MILTIFVVSIVLVACSEDSCPNLPLCPTPPTQECEVCNEREDDIVLHTITFKSGIEDYESFSVSIMNGQAAAMPFAPAAPNGYSFYGWFLGDSRFVFTTVITQDITLIARWQPIEVSIVEYTVSFIIHNDYEPLEIAVRDFARVEEPTTPSREGFSFMGWFLDATGVVEFNFNTAIVQDINVYAVWQADIFTITYIGDLNVIKNGEIVTYLEVAFGDNFILGIPDLPEALYYGLEFHGWFVGEGEQRVRLTDENGVGLYGWNIARDVEAVAVFNENYRIALLVFTRMADDSGYSVIAGSNASNLENIIIPRMFNGLPVVAIGDDAFRGLANLTQILLPATLITVGNNAFEGTGITVIMIGQNVISIGDEAFKNSAIEQVTLTHMGLDGVNIRRTTTIGENTFYGADNFSRIVFPTSHIVDWARTSDNNWRHHANIMDFSMWTDMQGNNPQSIVASYDALIFTPINNGNAYSVVLSESARHLQHIIVPRFFNNRPVTTIADNGFRHATFSHIRRNTGRIDLMQAGLHLFDTITTIGNHAFSDNFVLNMVHLHNVVAFMGTDVFANNRNLQTFEFMPFGAVSNLTAIPDRTFINNRSLGTVAIPASVTSIGVSAFEHNLSLTGVTFGAGSTLTSIGNRAFYNTRTFNILATALPASLVSIGNNAFTNTLAWAPTTALVLPASLTTIGTSAFQNSAITGVVVPNGVTSIPNFAFDGARRLSSVTLPTTLTSIGNNAFQNTTMLTSIDLPSSITTIGASAFMGSGLTSINIPNGVTTIQANTFNNARNLVTVNLPNGLMTIQNSAFQDTVSLRQITLPNSLTTLATMAFQRSGIESIVIPASVLRIEANTFNGATHLQFVQLLRWQPLLDAPNARITTLANINAFSGTTARIYIPTGSYNSYRVDAIATGAGNSVWNNAIFNGRMVEGAPS